MLFAVICNDKPGALAVRVETRPAHLAWIERLGNTIKAAGPLLSANGEPCGSLIVLEAESETACLELLAQDPYALAGLFASTEARPWRWLIKNPEA